jgi:hypothetical protein
MNRLIRERRPTNKLEMRFKQIDGEIKAEVKARAKCYLFLTSNLTSFIYIFGGQTFQKESIYRHTSNYL